MGSVEKRTSAFERAEFVPPDAIFDVTRRYVADTNPDKVNLGQGTYRDEDGRPWILPSVRLAEKSLGQPGHEYLPIAGLKTFRDEAVKLVFGTTKAFAENRIASCQSLSGTGALLLAGLALKKAATGITTVYVTDPTWSNHELLFASLGLEVRRLPYYRDRAFDFDGFVAALGSADAACAVVLHACAHNPTGCDPSLEQWRRIASVVAERGAFPVFDSAYLGFNSGSVDDDAWPIRYFVDELGLEAAVCLSFAKSMGLYGERVGAVAFVARSEDGARTVGSVLENVQRATVSNPPAYGARIAAAVLSTPRIRDQWTKDLVTMSGRIRAMRERLYDELVRLQTPGDWSHIVKQSGMFGYTGISKSQVQHLEEKYHVYMADTSRISIAGLNEKNVEYFAKALDDTVRSVA
ncbi:aminotransferase class I and II [Colletotrichum falcatum]|nr:aminotransferase class I and II [Colletotrichum falcatum]